MYPDHIQLPSRLPNISPSQFQVLPYLSIYSQAQFALPCPCVCGCEIIHGGTGKPLVAIPKEKWLFFLQQPTPANSASGGGGVSLQKFLTGLIL